eukprot:15452691-Alexandrium_andersonii.AAC.1
MPKKPNGQAVQAHHDFARNYHAKVPGQGRVGARALVEPELSVATPPSCTQNMQRLVKVCPPTLLQVNGNGAHPREVPSAESVRPRAPAPAANQLGESPKHAAGQALSRQLHTPPQSVPTASPTANGREGAAGKRKGQITLRQLIHGLAQIGARARLPKPA